VPAPAAAFDQAFENHSTFLDPGPVVVDLTTGTPIPDGATLLMWVFEANISGSPVTFDPVPDFALDNNGGFVISPEAFVGFYHKGYEGEASVSVSWVGGAPASVGVLVASFTDLPPHDLIKVGGPTNPGGTGLVAETYGLVLWYYAGDDAVDIVRADDDGTTLYGTIFGGAWTPFVLQEYHFHSTAVAGLAADGAIAGSQSRSSLTTWGDPSEGGAALDEWSLVG
jgi:hypothetical protein